MPGENSLATALALEVLPERFPVRMLVADSVIPILRYETNFSRVWRLSARLLE